MGTKTHGHTWVRENGTIGRSPTYQSWRAMIARCYHERHPWFHRYGGRGIYVCDEWRGRGGFARFLKEMGERPSADRTLDRKDVNKGYFRENCRWATKSEQRLNVERLHQCDELPKRAPKKGKAKLKKVEAKAKAKAKAKGKSNGRKKAAVSRVRKAGTPHASVPPF